MLPSIDAYRTQLKHNFLIERPRFVQRSVRFRFVVIPVVSLCFFIIPLVDTSVSMRNAMDSAFLLLASIIVLEYVVFSFWLSYMLYQLFEQLIGPARAKSESGDLDARKEWAAFAAAQRRILLISAVYICMGLPASFLFATTLFVRDLRFSMMVITNGTVAIGLVANFVVAGILVGPYVRKIRWRGRSKVAHKHIQTSLQAASRSEEADATTASKFSLY